MEIQPAYRNSALKFYYYPVGNSTDVRKPEGFCIRRATMLDCLLGTIGNGPTISLSRRFRRGDDYFIVKADGRIVSLGRICYKDTKEVVLGKGEASLISFYTAPEFRRRGLYVALINEMLKYLGVRGFKKCYIWADANNTASLVGIERAGFIPVDGPT